MQKQKEKEKTDARFETTAVVTAAAAQAKSSF
jgi:hypothetical protein